ncbi:MAG: tRNA uridine-5-carboxymethylaminomethyl(34) synthesis GTPase MnmE [Endomicrobium sp.]|jgi:tRNA modification GTPase|nr:tRNA uridine-5-carboxymethylaminomethyl(34) synthesis GTPase MnmE [Endomicrobium sp.]
MNYLKEDTIATLSTAAGKSAIAVIRMSGNNSFDILNKVFKTSSSKDNQIKYGFIVDGNEKKDEVLCSFFYAPNTYTGENLVEISVHGNPVIINEILTLLYKAGARPAEPGEFTYRSFLNGKKDLTQAEAVCNLITSKTSSSVKAALNNVKGTFSTKIKTIKNSITNLLAFMEVNLDHPEEDIIFLSREEKLARVETCIKDIESLLKSYKVSKVLQSGIKVALIGKPNAGKSSLLNAISGKNRAIVTDIAGTTRDTIEETIDCYGVPLTVIDTAGIRTHTENSIELLGQEKTKETIFSAGVLVWIFDSSLPIDKDDVQIANILNKEKLSIPIIAVLNKSDLPQKLNIDNNPLFSKLAASKIKISAKKETGLFTLLEKLTKVVGVNDIQSTNLMINSRHYTLLNNALEALQKTKLELSKKDADELVCFHAQVAQNALNEILGIEVKEDILDTIFSTFCVGK